MEIPQAVTIAESDSDVKEHMANGYHLSSVMAIPEHLTAIDQWTLVYYSPETQKVFSVEVKEDGVKKGEATAPLIQDEYHELQYEGALNSKDLLSKLLDVIAQERETPTRVIITLRDLQWKVAVITQTLKMLRIDLDMTTGEVKNIDTTSLVKPV